MLTYLTLHIPKTLHNELEILAKDEGISLSQYIVYALTQKVATEKLAVAGKGLTPEQIEFLANIKRVSPTQVADQKKAFEALLARLGPQATDEEIAQYLAAREPVEPEAGLEPEAVKRLQARLAFADIKFEDDRF